MENITAPQTLEKPFAESGDKNTIPSAATGTNRASLTEGFPPITQTPVISGGIPPERADFNGVLNLMSLFYFAFQNGWLPTFSEEVSTAIGGYALGAVLWYDNGTNKRCLRSTKQNNTDNFNEDPSFIGTSWIDVTPTQAGIDAALALKADVDLNNTSANLDYVVESGTDSITGINFRLWRSGLLEQFYNGQNTGDIINFPRAYAARPNIQATAVLTAGGNDTVLTITSASETGFSSVGRNTGGSGTSFTFDWYARGQAASP